MKFAHGWVRHYLQITKSWLAPSLVVSQSSDKCLACFKWHPCNRIHCNSNSITVLSQFHHDFARMIVAVRAFFSPMFFISRIILSSSPPHLRSADQQIMSSDNYAAGWKRAFEWWIVDYCGLRIKNTWKAEHMIARHEHNLLFKRYTDIA
jgi:hypothetical protein